MTAPASLPVRIVPRAMPAPPDPQTATWHDLCLFWADYHQRAARHFRAEIAKASRYLDRLLEDSPSAITLHNRMRASLNRMLDRMARHADAGLAWRVAAEGTPRIWNAEEAA